MSLRHEIASLLVGYDVERFRREHDEALVVLDEHRLRDVPMAGVKYPDRIMRIEPRIASFLDSLPLGAVKRARERLAER